VIKNKLATKMQNPEQKSLATFRTVSPRFIAPLRELLRLKAIMVMTAIPRKTIDASVIIF
tara:strand:+ start:7913 stop:8092 length:180 start_codon:yes stop_codon:yes gene_type:complete